MSRDDRDEDAIQRFAARLADNYRPAPLSPTDRARFDARLHERVAKRGRTPGWIPAVAAACAIGLALWFVPTLKSVSTPVPEPSHAQRAVAASGPEAFEESWETGVLLEQPYAAPDEEAYLPGDYAAIAFAFIDET